MAEHRRTGSYHLPGGTEAYDIGPDARFLLLNSADADSDMLWNLPEARSAADLGDAEYATAAPDGTAYLTRPFDRPGRVEVRRTDDGHVLFGTDVARALTTTALGPGGRLAAFCSADGPPQVWDVVHGKQLPGDWDNADGTVCGTGSGADSGERLLRLSPDGRRLAAVHGTTVTVWDVRGGRSVADFASGGTTGFTQADLSPDGEFLATVDDHEIAVWGLASGGGLAFHRPLAGAEASDLTWVPDHGRRTLRYLDRATVRSLDLTDRLTTARQNPRPTPRSSARTAPPSPPSPAPARATASSCAPPTPPRTPSGAPSAPCPVPPATRRLFSRSARTAAPSPSPTPRPRAAR
nr:WD40 repeat domain-containing protein [Streptomyces sp. LBUM 1477]